MTLDTNMNEEPAPAEKVGYGHPPKHSQFKVGAPSGNPKGRPKKSKNGLIELFAAELERGIPVPGKKRVKISKLQALVRHLVKNAAEGDEKALRTLIWALDMKEGSAEPVKSDWVVFSFSEVLGLGTTKKYDEAYFREQDKVIGEWLKQAKAGGSLKGMVELELSRKVVLPGPDDKPKKFTLADIIVKRFISAAKNDPPILKLLVRIIPEKKVKRRRDWFEVERPTRAEYEALGSHLPSWAPKPMD